MPEITVWYELRHTTGQIEHSVELDDAKTVSALQREVRQNHSHKLHNCDVDDLHVYPPGTTHPDSAEPVPVRTRLSDLLTPDQVRAGVALLIVVRYPASVLLREVEMIRRCWSRATRYNNDTSAWYAHQASDTSDDDDDALDVTTDCDRSPASAGNTQPPKRVKFAVERNEYYSIPSRAVDYQDYI